MSEAIQSLEGLGRFNLTEGRSHQWEINNCFDINIKQSVTPKRWYLSTKQHGVMKGLGST